MNTDYAGIDGFLGTRASLMLDVVAVALVVVLPLLGWSIYQVRIRRRYALHKKLQLGLAAALAVAVGLFELDMQLNGWEHRALESPYFEEEGPSLVRRVLWVHLLLAVTTAGLWIYVVARALLRFPKPPSPCPHSREHIPWGWLAAIDLLLTALTGWTFYWLAFVA